MLKTTRGAIRVPLAAAALLAVLVVAAGCGSSEAASGGTVPAAEKSAAKAAVAKASGEVKFISPGGPVDVAAQQGKQAWIIASDLSIPYLQNIVGGFEAGARAAGLRPVAFDGKGQTKEWARGIEQAIGAGAGAIAVSGIDTRFISGAIKHANAAHIPVVGIDDTSVGGKLDPGTAGEATADFTLSGELLVAYAVANTNGPVNALYSDTSEFRVMGFLKTGIEQGMRKYCGEACSLDTYDTQIANFKTELPTLTQSQLKLHPDTNWLFPAFDGQSVFVVPAIKQAGMGDQVRVGSINAVQANLDLIKNEDLQVVDIGNPNAWLGWAGVDRILRSLGGEKPAISEVPIKLFDKQNLEGVDTGDEAALFKGADYQAEYQRLWKK